MKNLIYLLFLISFSGISQTKELYDLAFSKKENFELLKIMGDKIPEKFLVIDSTIIWRPKTFYLENIDLKNPKVVEDINKEEHHYYHSLYLFADKTLDLLIEDDEKKILSEKAKLISSKKNHIQGRNYNTIKKLDEKGFYFLVSEPLYSSNKKFSFLYIVAKRKSMFLDKDLDEYFATFTIMIQKNYKEKWKQIGIKKHFIQ
jgi:hypothetical protein